MLAALARQSVCALELFVPLRFDSFPVRKLDLEGLNEVAWRLTLRGVEVTA